MRLISPFALRILWGVASAFLCNKGKASASPAPLHQKTNSKTLQGCHFNTAPVLKKAHYLDLPGLAPIRLCSCQAYKKRGTTEVIPLFALQDGLEPTTP